MAWPFYQGPRKPQVSDTGHPGWRREGWGHSTRPPDGSTETRRFPSATSLESRTCRGSPSQPREFHDVRAYFSTTRADVLACGPRPEWRVGRERPAQCLTNRVDRQRKIRDELVVGTALPIRRLARRGLQALADPAQREVVQERSVVKQAPAPAPQAVARKLPPGNRHVAGPLTSDVPHEPPERSGEYAEDETMGAIDPGQLGPPPAVEHGGVHQASRPGEHGRPAAGPSQDRHARAAARLDADLVVDDGRAADDDHFPAGLPEPQRLGRPLGEFRFVQQGLVQGEVFFRRGQRQVKISHGRSAGKW